MKYDEVLISNLVRSDNYYQDQKEVDDLRYDAIKMAHAYHFSNNRFYKNLCEIKGIDKTITIRDIPRVLIPDSVFKSYDVQNPETQPNMFHEWLNNISSFEINFNPPSPTKNLDDLLAYYDTQGLRLGFSSGTSGKLTFLPRDEFTQNMIAYSYSEAVDATVEVNRGVDQFILGIPSKTFLQVGYNGKITAQHLSNGNEENIFFGFTELTADLIRMRMRGPQNVKETMFNFLVKRLLPWKQRQSIKNMVKRLMDKKKQRIIFLAPPFLLVDAANYVIENNLELKLTNDSIIASTGGFKGRKVTSRKEMNNLLLKAFGTDTNQYLDLYGMTESNSIFVECTEGNNKHVPPWIEVILLDENLEPINNKEGKVTGRYGFLEPSSRSFPGFIMTGDIITVDYDGCPHCNKKTPIVTEIGRAPIEEGRGCSGVLSRSAR